MGEPEQKMETLTGSLSSFFGKEKVDKITNEIKLTSTDDLKESLQSYSKQKRREHNTALRALMDPFNYKKEKTMLYINGYRTIQKDIDDRMDELVKEGFTKKEIVSILEKRQEALGDSLAYEIEHLYPDETSSDILKRIGGERTVQFGGLAKGIDTKQVMIQ